MAQRAVRRGERSSLSCSPARSGPPPPAALLPNFVNRVKKIAVESWRQGAPQDAGKCHPRLSSAWRSPTLTLPPRALLHRAHPVPGQLRATLPHDRVMAGSAVGLDLDEKVHTPEDLFEISGYAISRRVIILSRKLLRRTRSPRSRRPPRRLARRTRSRSRSRRRR